MGWIDATDGLFADIDFIAPLKFANSEGYILMRAKKNVDHIFTLETASGGVSVFQDGIFVTQIRLIVDKRFRDFVRIHFAHTCRSDGIPEADGYSQNWQQRIVDSFGK